jgi:hypothetical protein
MSDPTKRPVNVGEIVAQLTREAVEMPRVYMNMPKPPTDAERHGFESSAEFIRRLTNRISLWRAQLQPGVQPVILALLSNGLVIRVRSISEEGHNGIGIEGRQEGGAGADYLILTHQANLQLLCYVEKAAELAPPIGFIVQGKEAK